MTESPVVLDEDPHCLAVAKPAGILTQGTPRGESTLEAAVRRYLSAERPSSVYLGTVHRLDRPVSGGCRLGQDAEGRAAVGRPVRAPRGAQGVLGGRRARRFGARRRRDLGRLADGR